MCVPSQGAPWCSCGRNQSKPAAQLELEWMCSMASFWQCCCRLLDITGYRKMASSSNNTYLAMKQLPSPQHFASSTNCSHTSCGLLTKREDVQPEPIACGQHVLSTCRGLLRDGCHRQVGFGWTNGVALDLMAGLGDRRNEHEAQ